ncbi:MAG: hypothetical protein GOV01_01170, partial [Candidatus Altiarchaeota archaeon]|nr:hypothetical protein [Candidatus Altiarchaeota archaeon]
MRKQWKVILKRGILGAVIFVVSLLPLRQLFLSLSFDNKNLDFVWVLFSIAIPHIIRFIALGILISAVFFAIKMITLPR